MPQMTMPGTTSRVWATTMSSAEFMSRAPMPGALWIIPSFCSRFTPAHIDIIIKHGNSVFKDSRLHQRLIAAAEAASRVHAQQTVI